MITLKPETNQLQNRLNRCATVKGALALILALGATAETSRAQYCVFQDDFQRPAAQTLGNGWQETEPAPAEVTLAYMDEFGFAKLLGPGAAMVQAGIDTTGRTNLTLYYSFSYADVYNEFTDKLRVEWRPSGTGTWLLLLTRKLNLGSARSDSFPLPAEAGDGPIDIRFALDVDQANEGAVVDDVRVCEPDCNDNGMGDSMDLAGGTSHDCNTNGVPDECDIAAGTSTDSYGAGFPDECTCDVDADCADGVYCNGVEVCVNSSCRPGDAMDCDDGVACTNDSCDETNNRCVNAPDDTLCDDGLFCNGAEVCDATEGCQAGTNPCAADMTCDETADSCRSPIVNDCNDNNIEDTDDISAGTSSDCNNNSVPDECDISGGTSQDNNGNGTPDECDPVATPTPTPAPTSGGGCGAMGAVTLLPMLLSLLVLKLRPRRPRGAG